MSRWNIAAAQYAAQHPSVDSHVKHHLRFIDEAARQQCQLLVFPELSLTGPGEADLPAPPDDLQLAPLLHAAQSHNLTVIAGLTLVHQGQRQKGLALFTPHLDTVLRYPQGRASLIPGINSSPLSIPSQTPLTSIRKPRYLPAARRWAITAGGSPSALLCSASRMRAIAVLMANARSGSELWDEKGQLIVRADKGELLLTGSLGRQGWQGDIIPLG